MTKEENLLTRNEKILKLRNSSSRYIKIPDDEFEEINHDSIATKILRKEDQEFIYVIYGFNKK